MAVLMLPMQEYRKVDFPVADLSFYGERYQLTTVERAFEKFTETLQNYYSADFYVNWRKVFNNTISHEREFALLSTLCDKPDKRQAARELLEAYPQIIPVLPILIACRNSVTLVQDAAKARVTEYNFIPLGVPYTAVDAERYAEFIVDSGIIELLEHIKSVADYMTGVEVGMDTNARKNRGGECGIQAIKPWIARAREAIPFLQVIPEATFEYLTSKGFSLPSSCRGLKWDFSFWIGESRKRLAVMEVNHYGGSGSKPPSIAREYSSRHASLKSAGIGFIWITDGLGWKSMRNPLREAFTVMDFMVNIRLASEGQLEAASAVTPAPPPRTLVEPRVLTGA